MLPVRVKGGDTPIWNVEEKCLNYAELGTWVHIIWSLQLRIPEYQEHAHPYVTFYPHGKMYVFLDLYYINCQIGL